MFNAVGRTVVVDEKIWTPLPDFPRAAGVCLHHPRSLAEAGVKVVLPRDVATLLGQTMKGAASVVLETGDHPRC